MRFLLIYFLAFLLMPGAAYSADDVKVVSVRGGVHVLINPQGGNVVVSSGEDGTFLIDDQLTGRSSIIADAVKKVAKAEAQFILNTHYHFDHTGGNEFFGEAGAVIVAHERVRERLNARQFITFFNKEMEPLSKAGLPVVTFSQDMTFHYNGDTIRVLHVPAAHTDGDVIAHFMEDNIIVTGDVVFHGGYPFIDFEHGGTIQGTLDALDLMIDLSNADTIFVPGHGGLMTVSDLKTYRDMLAAISILVQDGIRAGKTREQIVAEKPTQDFDAVIAHGVLSPDDFVAVLYDMFTHE